MNRYKYVHYRVLAGHRRLEAARLAGREQVPIVVRQLLPGVEPEELMLVEGCHRADLGPMEKAKAMGALRAKGYKTSRIARGGGLSQSAVSFYLTLLELDPATQERVRSGAPAAADAPASVCRVRKGQREEEGTTPSGRVREPDSFTDRHRLARKARALCDAQDHAERCRVGMVACGQCWETTIREDEKLAVATLRSVS